MERTMENFRKHRDIKLIITNRKRNYLGSEPNYHKTTLLFISNRNEEKKKKLIRSKTHIKNTTKI